MAEPAPIRLTAAQRAAVEQAALAAGFDIAGLTAIPAPDSADAARDAARFAEWIAAGRQGEMAWLSRASETGTLLREHPQIPMPWARSVLVCAVNYNAAPVRSIDPAASDAGWIARYAWSGAHESSASPQQGSDYHDVLVDKLRSVEAGLRADFGPALETRCYVDTGPLVERNAAAHAGVGWIGKNTCVLNQQLGSWLLLGVIVLSAELSPEATALTVPAADRCGTCTRCLDACPTGALIAPRQMDASLCISYLTIEKKGSIAEDLRPLMGRQVFGCDICQDVCPWNARAPITSEPLMPPRAELINPPLEALASLDGPAFKRLFRGSPLERTGRKRLLRNVAIAMGNSGEAKFRPQLETWAAGDDDPVLGEAAKWALAALDSAANTATASAAPIH